MRIKSVALFSVMLFVLSSSACKTSSKDEVPAPLRSMLTARQEPQIKIFKDEKCGFELSLPSDQWKDTGSGYSMFGITQGMLLTTDVGGYCSVNTKCVQSSPMDLNSYVQMMVSGGGKVSGKKSFAGIEAIFIESSMMRKKAYDVAFEKDGRMRGIQFLGCGSEKIDTILASVQLK